MQAIELFMQKKDGHAADVLNLRASGDSYGSP
jgi:hypothetical protein